MALRLALISPSSLVLAGLRAGLGEYEGLDVVWMGQTLTDWQDAGFAGADVAILDVGADAIPGLDTIPSCAGPAFVLLADDQSNHVHSWLEEGFTVLPPDASLEMIAGAAHAAAAGLVASSRQRWTNTLRFARLGDCDGAAEFEPLTPRETEVLLR